ncbi:hypothetical protein AO268_22485 [Pseudomonas sp. ICMP 8385]|jgi:hypothetical protein|uniref:hypothetical protein n=1 Tax=Pseudomonas sp. ICMP 8385 TaxID=1718920 RepID=UPI000C08C432|nr:hypothetical protein [Pseudomonas sp. ICMP 8385]PHN66482.1 hypothetical protein AO268_22485 [Pseudomonas sp. ICMP 8385]
MSGSLQSHDYVPGMSGLKIDLKAGTLEINSCTLGSAAKAPERQMVSVEVASWSKYDLPKNAANLLQFMQAELERVPEQYRHVAEFEEFDASYGRESFNARLFLSYSRLETEQELADRLEKAKVAGTHICIKAGVIEISHDGALAPQFTVNTELVSSFARGGDDGSLADAISNWHTGTALKAGGVASALNAVSSASDEPRHVAQLVVDVEGFEADFAKVVKDVLRSELLPGGLLHRSR